MPGGLGGFKRDWCRPTGSSLAPLVLVGLTWIVRRVLQVWSSAPRPVVRNIALEEGPTQLLVAVLPADACDP